MEYKLEKIQNLSGDQASIFTLRPISGGNTLFENFIIENKDEFMGEVSDIYNRLKAIGRKTGIRKGFIKEHEGSPGDGVIALYDLEESNLRVYGIKYGSSLLIIGGGGYKSKEIRALQEDPKLQKENQIMREVSAAITKRMKEKEISHDFMDFEGDLIFEIQ